MHKICIILKVPAGKDKMYVRTARGTWHCGDTYSLTYYSHKGIR